MTRVEELLVLTSLLQGDRPKLRRPRGKPTPPDHIARRAKKNMGKNSAARASRKKNR